MLPTERIAGGFWGLLVGDALGVPYEFHAAKDLPPHGQLEFQPPSDFRRTYPDVPPGTWSDDGAQALILLDSLLHCGVLDLDDFADRLAQWYEDGYLAVDGHVFDVGVTTASGIRRFRAGMPAAQSGPAGERENGNGALMRALPLALWHKGSDRELARDAMVQGLPTHGHPRSQLCCALYCLWARGLLEERAAPWEEAVGALRALVQGSLLEEELEFHIHPYREPVGHGSGYVVDSLHSARMLMNCGSYESVVKSAVALGRDTDTTACIVGGLAGIRDGINAIPERWLSALRGKQMSEPLLDRLLARFGRVTH